MPTKTRPRGPSAALEAAVAATEVPAPPKEKLERLRSMVKDARKVIQRITNGTELLKTLRGERNDYLQKKIPDLMDEVGVTSITVKGEGNEPPFRADESAYYSANIAADWEEEKKEEAYDYLVEIGHDDLIRQEVTFSFPRGVTQRQVNSFVRAAGKIKVRGLEVPYPSVRRGVNPQTLTAWLKTQVEQEGFVPSLSKIGGTVGKIVKIKEVKE